VQAAFRVHRAGKMLVPIIDDANLMPADGLRKLQLLCEDLALARAPARPETLRPPWSKPLR